MAILVSGQCGPVHRSVQSQWGSSDPRCTTTKPKKTIGRVVCLVTSQAGKELSWELPRVPSWINYDPKWLRKHKVDYLLLHLPTHVYPLSDQTFRRAACLLQTTIITTTHESIDVEKPNIDWNIERQIFFQVCCNGKRSVACGPCASLCTKLRDEIRDAQIPSYRP